MSTTAGTLATEPFPRRRAFLYADPAAHSLSPAMHLAAFQHAGLNGTYEALRIKPEELPAALDALRTKNVLGANLSLPHKESALPLLDALTPTATAIGAVNTVIHRDGHLTGDNTDAPGLVAALRDAGYVPAPGGTAVVLGAGGAARAAVYALRMAGQDVLILNRTAVRAHDLARDLPLAQQPGQTRAVTLPDIDWMSVNLVVNSSSAGLNDPTQTPLDATYLRRLPPGALVYDMVYKPTETRLMRESRDCGLTAGNGLGMLAHQAQLAFRAWTGADVPVQVFLSALHGATGPAAGAPA